MAHGLCQAPFEWFNFVSPRQKGEQPRRLADRPKQEPGEPSGSPHGRPNRGKPNTDKPPFSGMSACFGFGLLNPCAFQRESIIIIAGASVNMNEG